MDTNGGNQEVNYTGTAQAPVAPPAATKPAPAPTSEQPIEVLHWNASEFVDHQKSVLWILPVCLVAVVLAAIMYVLTRNLFSSIVVLLAGIAFGVFAYQKPRTVSYSLFPSSIKIGQKTYSYDDFRTFSIMQEGALYSVFLEPIKRFMPPLTIYFAAEDGEKIFDTLAQHIPHQEKAPDALDRFMQRIRF